MVRDRVASRWLPRIAVMAILVLVSYHLHAVATSHKTEKGGLACAACVIHGKVAPGSSTPAIALELLEQRALAPFVPASARIVVLDCGSRAPPVD